MQASTFLTTTFRSPYRSFARPICRLGLASRGDSHLTAEDVLFAVDRGINFLNWYGGPNGLSKAVSRLGRQREEVMVCVQFQARTAADARTELRSILGNLASSYVDALTFYYVEQAEEWQQIAAPGGPLEVCRRAQRDGQVRLLGLTTHQRPLAAAIAKTNELDMLMIRYNAAHRGAETQVFPLTDALGLPVVVYTCLRWGTLLRPTPDDPPDFAPPPAPAWYRFALQHPSVTVALMAPDDRHEMEENLTVLDCNEPLILDEYQRLAWHGTRVRSYAGIF